MYTSYGQISENLLTELIKVKGKDYARKVIRDIHKNTRSMSINTLNRFMNYIEHYQDK